MRRGICKWPLIYIGNMHFLGVIAYICKICNYPSFAYVTDSAYISAYTGFFCLCIYAPLHRYAVCRYAEKKSPGIWKNRIKPFGRESWTRTLSDLICIFDIWVTCDLSVVFMSTLVASWAGFLQHQSLWKITMKCFSVKMKAVVVLVVISLVSSLRSTMTMSAGSKKKVAILGASGYTGAELMRLMDCAAWRITHLLMHFTDSTKIRGDWHH